MKINKYLLGCPLLVVMASCNSYLDVKPQSSLALVQSVDDYLAIVQNETRMNMNYPFSYDYASDHFYLAQENIDALDETGRYAYLWAPEPAHQNNWSQNYARIYDANVVLEGIEQATLGNKIELDRNLAQGTAAFIKGFTLLHLVAMYAPTFEKGKNEGKLGVPIRPSADIGQKSVRPSLDNCYAEIDRLLNMASQLLPLQTKAKTIPNREAAWAALARYYLLTQDYEKGYRYADSCLQFKDDLIDYNTLNPALSQSQFPQGNKEVIFHAVKGDFSGMASSSRARVDSLLLRKYEENDLRKALFYRKNIDGAIGFYGSYDGNIASALFSGMARDELYLIASECAVRIGKINIALYWINLLRKNRMDKNSFVAFVATDPDEILQFVLQEREKELAFRAGLRWMDLRRLNLENRFRKTLIRNYKGKEYKLEPNDNRYIFKIPEDVIAIGQMEQNP